VRGRRRFWALLGVVLALAALGVFSQFHAVRAGRQALAAKAALLRAEERLGSQELEPARAELTLAKLSLVRMKDELDALGPVLPVARFIPIVRSQVLAVETFQSAGTTLADAGLNLSDAVQKTLDTTKGGAPLSGVLDNLRGINESLASGAASVRSALREVNKLEGKWLVGPIGGARDDLLERLPRYERQATSTADGVDALIRFVGGEGPRRYLFLSQNPDEIRPTGGFIGTYGLLSATPGNLDLERFEPIGGFRERHPTSFVPGGETRSPFRFASPPTPQTLANVNSVADFAQAGKLAADLWNGAGEPPVDGVVSFTPAFLARILGVLGAVEVEDYGETVDQENLIERFTFYTAQLELASQNDAARKGFLSSLAEVVMRKLLAAPSSQWQAIGEAVGQGFAAREAMAWSSDQVVQATLARRGWDGVLPTVSGDFFYNGEFAYAAKIDRGLQRTFDHHVLLRADGSGRVTTTMRLTNTRGPSPALNPGSLAYITIYGPQGAVLHPSSDPPVSEEPAIAGHPAAGWFLNAPPRGTVSLKVAWEVKDLTRKGPNGTREYTLTWLKVPDHSGDAVNLRVDLPEGWRWAGDPPPSGIELTEDIEASWVMTRSRPFS